MVYLCPICYKNTEHLYNGVCNNPDCQETKQQYDLRVRLKKNITKAELTCDPNFLLAKSNSLRGQHIESPRLKHSNYCIKCNDNMPDYGSNYCTECINKYCMICKKERNSDNKFMLCNDCTNVYNSKVELEL